MLLWGQGWCIGIWNLRALGIGWGAWFWNTVVHMLQKWTIFFPFLFLLIYSPTVVQYLMINVSVSLFTQCAYLFITGRSLIYRWFNVVFLGVYGEKGIEYSQKSYQNYWWESLIQVPWFQITIPPSEVLSVIHLKNTFRWQCVKKILLKKEARYNSI